MYVLNGNLDENKDGKDILNFLSGNNSPLTHYSGDLDIILGKIQNSVTILNNRSIAEDVTVNRNGAPFQDWTSGPIPQLFLPFGPPQAPKPKNL